MEHNNKEVNMKTIETGHRVPYITLPILKNDQWDTLSTEALFANRTVIVFSLPGAFTPTCSSLQTPRYNELAGAFKSHGVDEIVCVSVNDTFVMNAWKDSQDADNITFLPDGNGEFTQGMGMLVDKRDLGFGKRSWRYSMLVKNGVVEKAFVEPDEPGDPFHVSDADTLLRYIAPDFQPQQSITVFTKPGCTFCHKAKQQLMDAGLHFEEIVLGQDATSVSLMAVSGSSKVPQVFIDGHRIGGSDHLERYLDNQPVA